MTFEAFWALYPRRQGKKDARKAWDKLGVDAALWAEIEAALEWQTRQPAWTRERGTYVPYPATWLRGERWTDERPEVPTTSARDWRDECAALHGGRCSNIFFHLAKKEATA